MPNLFEIAPPKGYILSPYGTGKLIKKKHYPARKKRADMLKEQRKKIKSLSFQKINYLIILLHTSSLKIFFQ